MRIAGTGIALPEHRYSSEEILKHAKRWLSDFPDQSELLERFIRNSRVQERCFSLPLEEILDLGNTEKRAEIFRGKGTSLGVKAAREAMERAEVRPEDIGLLITTSCSIPLIPPIDVRIINELRLSPAVRRVPIFQYGCAGGAAGLALCDSMAGSCGCALLVSVELCSLVYQGRDLNPANLVGSALFGDGAGSSVVKKGGSGIDIVDSRTNLIPSSEHLMGYSLRDDGLHLMLDKELPQAVLENAPRLITEFLSRHGIEPDELKAWIIHPGGMRILNLLEQGLRLKPDQTRWSWNVLKKYGNTSSATVLMVLNEFLRSDSCVAGDSALIVGIGPGLSVELLLLKA